MNRPQQENPLGTAEISSLLLKFSIPAIIGMVVNALYNVVDRIYIGNAPGLGSSGLAGITIGFPIMIINIPFASLRHKKSLKCCAERDIIWVVPQVHYRARGGECVSLGKTA